MTTTLAPAFSQPSVYDGPAGRVHHGYSTRKATAADVAIGVEPVTAFKGVHGAWFAKLEPGGFIVPHVDKGPWIERWHYPISGRGVVWQEWRDIGVGVVTVEDQPYRMYHHQPHAVWNPYDEPRIILIVEYDNPVDQPTTDLTICPMIPQIQEMIDAL